MTDAIQAYTGGELTVTGPTATAAIFSTYPADYLGIWGGVIDQVGYWAFTDFTIMHNWTENDLLPDSRLCRSA